MTITLTALQKQRRDTASNWTSNNTVLLAGEWGIESDTKKFKIGDGSTAWQSLDYVPIPDTNRLLAGNLTVGGNFTVNGTTTTINSAPDAVEGPMIGLGAQLESPIPFLDVVRLEATYTDYGKMTIDSTSTGSGESDVDTRSGEAEQITFTIGLAKSF